MLCSGCDKFTFHYLFRGKSGGVYNFSNVKSIVTIAEVAKMCGSIAGVKVVFDLPDQIEEKGFSKQQNCILDNTKLSLLGWSGRYMLESGLMKTIDSMIWDFEK